VAQKEVTEGEWMATEYFIPLFLVYLTTSSAAQSIASNERVVNDLETMLKKRP
jgi:hypothetical protein